MSDARSQSHPAWSWDGFVSEAMKFYRLPDFDGRERNYKVLLAKALKAAIDGLIANPNAETVKAFRKVMQSKEQNIVRWQDANPFLAWVASDSAGAAAAVAKIANADAEIATRIRGFVAALPPGTIKNPGARTSLASLLLSANDPERLIVFRSTAFSWAYEHAGEPAPSDGDEADRYLRALQFCDRLITEGLGRGLTLRDRLDAQSLVWYMCKADRRPEQMSESDWEGFRRFHGSVEAAEPSPGAASPLFSWIPIHVETATRLMNMAEPQAEMLAALRAMEQAGLNVISLEDRRSDGEGPLDEIDPFTFFASFNRGTKDEKRRENWQFLKQRWNLASNVPVDFTGIPIAHPMASWFFPSADERQPDHVDQLWELARQAVGPEAQLESGRFDACIELKQCTVPKLTMGLFWLNPNRHLAADKLNRDYAEHLGVTVKPVDFASYGEWVAAVTSRCGDDLPRISKAAYDWATTGIAHSKEQPKRYWVLAPGQNASHWELCKAKGICVIDYNELNDLRAYPTREDMRLALVAESDGGEDKRIHSLAVWQFANEMKPGDIVFAKQGNTKMVAVGEVTGDYRFAGDREDFRHERPVKWFRQGPWSLTPDIRFPLKTLTDVTKYAEFVEALLRISGANANGEPVAEVPGGIAAGAEQRPVAEARDSEPMPYTRADALKELFVGEEQFGAILEALEEKRNVILQGPPGVGKTFVARRLAYALMGQRDDQRVGMVQFHQSYSYEDFIQGFRPTPTGAFQLRPGVFYEFCRRARADEASGRRYVFVIDEINRGNLSKIFGELMMLIEPDKRGAAHGMRLTYSESEGERFYVPENVYVIGTMNTADRSLALVDYALRRRFRFVSLRPAFHEASYQEFLARRGAAQSLVEKIVARMTALNADISGNAKDLGAGYEIGHSYFCPHGPVVPDDGWYRRVVESEIVPLLEEYWFEDADQVRRRRDDLLD